MHIMHEPTHPHSDGDPVANRDVTFIFHGWRPIEIEEGHIIPMEPSGEDATYVHATFVFRGDSPFAVLFAGVEQALETIPRIHVKSL
jgi:hypothetical protein